MVKTHCSEQENGIEAWRALHETYEPRTIQTETTMMPKVLKIARTESWDAEDVPSADTEVEDRVRRFNRAGGQKTQRWRTQQTIAHSGEQTTFLADATFDFSTLFLTSVTRAAHLGPSG